MESALLVMVAMDFVPIIIGLVNAAVRSGGERSSKKGKAAEPGCVND